MRDCLLSYVVFLYASSLLLAFPFLPDVAQDVEEELIPEEGEACGQSGLQKAGREAFKAASDTFLFDYLNRTVYQACVGPHLYSRNRQ